MVFADRAKARMGRTGLRLCLRLLRCGMARPVRKPLAIDLYAGLGGWAEGLLAEGLRLIGEGYLCYDLIWHTKRVRSRIGSGKRLINLAIAGFGRRVDSHLDMADLLSRKVKALLARTGFLTNLKSGKFPLAYASCTAAITRHALTLLTYFSALMPTMGRTCERRGVGDTWLGTKTASAIQTQFSLMLKSPRCFSTFQMAGGR